MIDYGTDSWSLLGLAGWEIAVTPHDLGIKVVGRRGDERVVRYGGSVTAVTSDFFEAARDSAPGVMNP